MTKSMLWLCVDKRELRLQDMETSHIRNSIAGSWRSIRTKDGITRGWRAKFLKPLLAEIARRGSKDNADLNPSRISNRFRNLDLD